MTEKQQNTIKNLEEIKKIREILERIANNCATDAEDLLIYRMYGSLSTEQAQGMIKGITTCLRHI